MTANIRELLDLVVRWVHLVAGIMWIGNSMLFMWLDANLEKEDSAKANDPGFQGRIWLVHSGGFYDVVKKQLAPGQMPERLHWFMYQNLSTWVSGIGLLVIVYYLGGGAYLVDPSISQIGVPAAIGIGAGAIVVSWVFYDLLMRSPIGKNAGVAAAICLIYLAGLSYGLAHVLSGRAAYIHVGVVLGTLMTGNVWMVIIPSQRELVAATKAGREQDPRFGQRAKQRSTHNNYMTFPLLFIMVSNHFPSTYGSKINWVILGVLMVGGALTRHFMNIRYWFHAWAPSMAATITITLVALFWLTKPEPRVVSIAAEGVSATVSFKTVRGVMKERCVRCHSANPVDEVWKSAPAGVMFDTPEQIKAMAPRIKDRAVISKTMPLGNKTGMTEAERDLLGDWIEQGAVIQ